jgi:hypothetical protein
MDLLAVNAVPRRRILLDKALAVLVDLLAVTAALAVVLLVFNVVVGLDIAPAALVAASLFSAALAMPFGALALLVGALTGRRGLAVAIPIGVAVVTFLVQTLAELADWLRPWRVLSPFHHAAVGDALSGNANVVGVVVLLCATGVDNSVHLFADTTRALPATDLDGRDLLVSCGAALHHLRVGFAALGWATMVRRLPDPAEPDHLAAVTFSRSRRPSRIAAPTAGASAPGRCPQIWYGCWSIGRRSTARSWCPPTIRATGSGSPQPSAPRRGSRE